MTSELLEDHWLDQVRDAMGAAGVPYGGPLVPDGAIHRFHVEGDRRDSRNGWYVLHEDGQPAGAFGSMKTAQKVKWSAKGVQPLSREDRQTHARQIAKRRAQRVAAELERWETSASQAEAMWEAATPVTEHPYLSRKGVLGYDVRVGDFVRQLPPGPNGEARSKIYPGALLIPLRDSHRKFWNLQAIFPEPVKWGAEQIRDKAFIYGARKQGLWATIGRPQGEEVPAVLVEGYATGATIHAATGLPVAVAFDAGNLVAVAKEVRRLRPSSGLLVAADDDRWGMSEPRRNVGVEKASLAALLARGSLIVPHFADVAGQPTDFNDLQEAEGLDAVRRQFEAYLVGGEADPPPTKAATPGDGQGSEEQRSTPVMPSSAVAVGAARRPVAARAQLGEDRLSEDAMAEALAAETQDKLRYCHSEGRWFIWSEGIWRRDLVGETLDLVRQTVRRMSAHEQRPERFRSSRFVSGVAAFAMRDPRLGRDNSSWDSNRMLLGTPGQVFDLATGRPVAPDPDHGITRSTAVAPAEKANCPQWLKFLQQVSGGDEDTITFLRRFFGSCLTGETRDQTLLFIHGDGGNGKGVFMDIIREILGTYAATATTDMLMETKLPKHSTDLAMLKGGRLAVASETDQGAAWAESRIKLMTGSDPITARFMRRDNFTYLPEFKLVVVGNHMPTLKNVDEAMRRRFRIVPFNHKPASVDKFLREKLRAEAPAILRWLLDGCLEWQQEGLGGSMVIQEATREYLGEQDLHSQWLSERCLVRRGDKSVRALSSDLYDSFRSFAKAAGEEPGSLKSLSVWLVGAGFERCRDNSARMISGLRLQAVGDR